MMKKTAREKKEGSWTAKGTDLLSTHFCCRLVHADVILFFLLTSDDDGLA
jgi:hypothetical protein